MELLTALLAGIAFVAVPFLAIGTIFVFGLAMQGLWHASSDSLHRLASHIHPHATQSR
jgi:hypothetical protein